MAQNIKQTANSDMPTKTKQEEPIKSYTVGKSIFMIPIDRHTATQAIADRRPADMLLIALSGVFLCELKYLAEEGTIQRHLLNFTALRD
jgi:hypothetical protein